MPLVRALDQLGDAAHDGVAVVAGGEHAGLGVDDDEGGGGASVEGGHGSSWGSGCHQ
ncbi:hypothetical protein [Mariniluteicoccus endophyticus]